MEHRDAMEWIFVVTGSNKGIGYAIVKYLAEKVTHGLIYLTARNCSRGEEALQKIVEILGESRSANIRFHQLDITDDESVERFANYLRKEHDYFDVLINNAGCAYLNSAAEPVAIQARDTLAVNYYGTKRVSEALLPLMRSGGRVVNICSQMGHISPGTYSEEIRKKLKNSSLTVADIDKFCDEYLTACVEDKQIEGGYPINPYAVSMTAKIALTFVQARQMRSKKIIINACCPGSVKTDMTGHRGKRTVEEGADTPIYLALLKQSKPWGKLLYSRKVKEWDSPPDWTK